jgi:hypothetical protein
MEATTEVSTEKVRKRGYGGVIVLAVVLLGLVLLAANYQQELLNYWKLQGWNTGAVKQTVERFVREAYEGRPSAGDLLDTAWAEPVVEGGKLVGVRHSGARGPEVSRLKPVLPEGTVKDCAVRIKNRSGVFQADVQFPNGQWGSFDVDRIQGALRIRSVPNALSSTKPPVQPWD